MQFHEPHRLRFLQHAANTTADQLTTPVAQYGVHFQPADVSIGTTYWRVIGMHHLSPDENRGRNNIFIDALDEQGKPIYNPNFRVRWGWEGQHPEQKSEPKPLDKRPPEPASNLDIYRPQKTWVEIMGDGLPSDRVLNLHTDHLDERGQNGEIWSGNGHHSFYVVFQRTRRLPDTNPIIETPGIVKTPPTPTVTTSETLQVTNFGPISQQDIINAFAQAAGQLALRDPWELLTRAGLSVHGLAADRRMRYTGTPIHELPNLTVAEKNLLMQQLSIVLVTMPVPPRQTVTPAPQPAITKPSPTPTTTALPPGPPAPPAQGNRIGFYLHVSMDQHGLWDAIRQVQPPVILVHADTMNRMLLQEIRSFRAPNAFVIGRLYKDSHTQRMMLTQGDPVANGRAMAEEILALDFGVATQRGSNGRLLIDAWMSLNEAVPGPASRQFAEQSNETAALLHAYDAFQAAFHARLQEAGIESIAFNFGAGNFTRPEHYLDYFPKTLAACTYLGFHEYGWPTLQPAPDSATSAGLYRTCLEGIRAHYGPRHRVVITEAGLARMYKDGSAGDVGWLNQVQTVSQDAYWESLSWYNQHLLADEYVVGACLYEVGHHGDWATFRHLGTDNQGQHLQLMDRIASLNATPRRSRGRKRGGARSLAGAGFVRVHGQEFVVEGRALRFIGVNVRGLAHYGDAQALPATTPEHRSEAIRAAREMGARVIRIFLPNVFVDTETTINRLRSLIELVKAEAPGMYILPALSNLYNDVAFRVPGDDGFYERLDPHFNKDLLNATFFKEGYRLHYLPFVQRVVQAFRDEPAIFAWEIGNELKLERLREPLESDPNIDTFLNFMHTMAQEIRQRDPNHLITTGMISTHHAWLHTPALKRRLYGNDDFDFLTVHCYNDERHNDDHRLAQELNKPYIVEEAGYSRENGKDFGGKYREDLAYWLQRDARGYMPWGFMATHGDNGDGDRDSGMDRKFHSDWDSLFGLLRHQAQQLATAVVTLPPLVTVDVGTPATATTSFLPGFQVGQTVFATDWLNIRRSPGYIGKLGDDVVGMIAPSSPATISGGAINADGLLWWPVRSTLPDGNAIEGWAAQATGTTHLLSAQQRRGQGVSAGMPQRARGRGTAHGRGVRSSETQQLHTTTYVNLRHSPGYVNKPSDDIIGQIPHGTPVTILKSPVHADGLNWLPVRASLLDNRVESGWAAEVDPNGTVLLSKTVPPPPAPIVGGVHGTPFGPGATLQLLNNASLHGTEPTGEFRPLGQIVPTLAPTSIATVVEGPSMREGIEWWHVTQTLANGQVVVGWVPLTDEKGMRLLASTATAQAIDVARPFAGNWPMSQGWGTNPDIYRQFNYDGVFLKGHNGVDFATDMYTPLLATDDGIVLRVDFEEKGFGNFVILQHAWGESLYAHLAQVNLGERTPVQRGQTIGLSGDSGFKTGPHLHFGIRVYPYRRTDGWGGFVNPIPFMQLDGIAIPRRGRSRVAIMAPELPGRLRP